MESWSITNVSAYHGIQNNGPGSYSCTIVVSQSNHKIFVRSLSTYCNITTISHDNNLPTESLHQTMATKQWLIRTISSSLILLTGWLDPHGISCWFNKDFHFYHLKTFCVLHSHKWHFAYISKLLLMFINRSDL